ncbi:MAG: cob(I)yrinic acid a,c-diamide adenosyltransferase [Pyrinomonadaceae bacterium]
MNSEQQDETATIDANVDERHAEVMRKRKASYDERKAAATKEKGLLIVNTGAGKGKTSAALGLIFRALGHGMRVGVVQFTKGAIETGEAAFAAQLEGRVDFFTLGEGYTWETQNRQRDIATARQAWDQARALLDNPQYQLVVLDELNIVLKYDYVPLSEVLETLKHKREDLHVIVTGRNAKDELIELADLVTDMKLVKHPYKSGIKAQRGIEF